MPVAAYPARFPGFVRPEPLQVWRDETTLGEAEPVAMEPEPQEDAEGNSPAFALAASGPLAPGTTIEVETLAPGYLGTAGYGWRRTVASGAAVSEDLRGQDVPNVLTGHTAGGWTSGTVVRSYPVGLTLPNGAQVVAASGKLLPASTTWRVTIRTYDPDVGSFSTDNNIVTGLSNTAAPYPCLCYLADRGIVLCAYWAIDDDIDEAQVNIYASRDDGDTWSLWQRGVLPDGVSTDGATGYTPGRLRMVYAGAQVYLFGELTDNGGAGVVSQVWQWASSDVGRSFSIICDDDDADEARARPEIVAVGSRVFLGLLRWDSGFSFVYFNLYMLGSAYEKFTEAADLNTLAGVVVGAGTGAPEEITAGELAMCRVADKIAIYVQQFGGGVSTGTPTAYLFDPANPYATTQSSDYLGEWFDDGQATRTEVPVNFHAQEWRGQVHIFAQMTSDSGDFDDKWTRIELGGFSTRTMPPQNNTWAAHLRATWDVVTVASSEPEAQDWTAPASAGTVTRTADPTWERVTTTAGNQHYWRSVDTFDESELIIVTGRVKQISGGSTAARDIAVIVRGATNTVAGYQAELWFSSTQIRLRDQNGGTTIATTNADVATGVEVLIAQKGPSVRAYYRVLGVDNQDRAWTSIGSSDALTDDIGVSGAGYVEFGNRTTAGASAQYLPMRISAGAYGEAAFSNPDELWPAPYTAAASFVGYGMSLQGSGGPAATGDTYLVRGDAQYPARAAIARGSGLSDPDVMGGTRPSPRPDEGWRSTEDQGRIAFQPPGGLLTSIERGVLVCHIERPNFGRAGVQIHSSGSWSSLGTIDARGSAISLPYVRSGARLVLDPGGSYTNAPAFLDSELIGGYAALSATKIRPIAGNRGGVWSLTAYGPRPVIDLDPASIDGTEPTSGTMDIWYPRVTFVAYLAAQEIAGFALNFSSATATYEGYLRAGLIVFGEGWLTVAPADWGLGLSLTTSAILETLQTGQRISRTLAPSRSGFSLPFVAPVTRQAVDNNRIVYYPTTTAGRPPFAAFGEDANVLRGLIDDAQGAQELVLYMPGFVAGPPNTYSCVSDQAAMVGRIVSEDWTQTMQAGHEQLPAWKGAVIEFEQET